MSGLRISGLEHRYAGGAVEVLQPLELAVDEGAFVSIVGPSGCGKSTLLRILAGLVLPSRGDAVWAGESLVGRPGRAAYMPQRDLLLPWRDALGNAALAAEIAGATRAEARARAEALFGRFGLAGFESAWPNELSGGMRQRLALLRTFLADRPLMLLDEPFGALDAVSRAQMQMWLQEVWGDDRRTVLFVTHDVEEALLLSDRVLVMSTRPARVLADVAVVAPRPRAASARLDPWLIDLRRELLATLESAS